MGPATSAPPLIGLDRTTPLVSAVPSPQAQAPVNVALATAPTLADDRSLYDDNSYQASSAPATSSFRPDVIARMQVEHRILDMRRVLPIQSLRFAPSPDGTNLPQILVRSIHEAFSGIIDVTGPTGTVTFASPA